MTKKLFPSNRRVIEKLTRATINKMYVRKSLKISSRCNLYIARIRCLDYNVKTLRRKLQQVVRLNVTLKNKDNISCRKIRQLI